jgi:hypothetical protein
MFRADGSSPKCKSSIGTIHIVATDFNPLNYRLKFKKNEKFKKMDSRSFIYCDEFTG